MNLKTATFACVWLALGTSFVFAQIKHDPGAISSPPSRPAPSPADYRNAAATQELSSCVESKLAAVSKIYELVDQNRTLQTQVDDLTKKLADATPKDAPQKTP